MCFRSGPVRTGFDLRVDGGNLLLQGRIDCSLHVLASTGCVRDVRGREQAVTNPGGVS